YDPGAASQVLMLGVPSTANSGARVLGVTDARTVAHHPSIALLSPNENQEIGFTFDGSNTVGSVKSSVDMSFQVNGMTSATEAMRISSAGNVGVGTPTPNALLDVSGTMRVATICDSSGANCKTVSSGWGATTLQGYAVSTNAPGNANLLIYNTSGSQW